MLQYSPTHTLFLTTICQILWFSCAAKDDCVCSVVTIDNHVSYTLPLTIFSHSLGSQKRYTSQSLFQNFENSTIPLTASSSSDVCGVGEEQRVALQGKACLFHARQKCFADTAAQALQSAGCLAAIHISRLPFLPGFFIRTSWLYKVHIPVLDLAESWDHWQAVIDATEAGRNVSIRLTSAPSPECLGCCHDMTYNFDKVFASVGVWVPLRIFVCIVNGVAALFALSAFFIRVGVNKMNKKSSFDLPITILLVSMMGCFVRFLFASIDPFFTTGTIPYEISIALIDIYMPFSFFSSTAMCVYLKRTIKRNTPYTSTQIFTLCGAAGLGIVMVCFSILRPIYENDLLHDGGRLSFASFVFVILTNAVMCLHQAYCGWSFVRGYKHRHVSTLTDTFSEQARIQGEAEHYATLRNVTFLTACGSAMRAGMCATCVWISFAESFTPTAWVVFAALVLFGDSFCAMVVAAMVLHFAVIIRTSYRNVMESYTEDTQSQSSHYTQSTNTTPSLHPPHQQQQQTRPHKTSSTHSHHQHHQHKHHQTPQQQQQQPQQPGLLQPPPARKFHHLNHNQRQQYQQIPNEQQQQQQQQSRTRSRSHPRAININTPTESTRLQHTSAVSNPHRRTHTSLSPHSPLLRLLWSRNIEGGPAVVEGNPAAGGLYGSSSPGVGVVGSAGDGSEMGAGGGGGGLGGRVSQRRLV